MDTQAQYSDLEAIEQLPSMNAAAYDAASLDDRAMFNWAPSATSANAELEDEQEIMVGRSRDIFRNDGVATGGKQTLKDNIVGATLRLSAKPDYRLLGKTVEWQREWAKNTEAQFRSYADSTECDAARSSTLLGLTLQMLDGSIQNGDAVALPIWKPRPGSRWGTRFQLVEADRLATPVGMEMRKNLNGGIQSDLHGEPLKYWFMKSHPGDRWTLRMSAPDQWTSVDAFDEVGTRKVIHLADKERVGQSRAKPLIASVIRELKMTGKYANTELQTAIASSLIAGVLESDLDPETMGAILGEGGAAKFDERINGFRSQLKSGAILKAPVGTRMHLMSSGRNNAAFEQFMMTLLRKTAVGFNIPYELLLKDFSQTNYSSARAALLEAWRYFYGRRRWLSDYWLTCVYEIWLEEAIAHGRVEAPDFYENRFAYTRCRWIMQGRGWVDPVKEANASKIRMQNNLSTLENECAEQGLDWEDVLEQRAYEKERAIELGVELMVEDAVASPAANVEEDEPEEAIPGEKTVSQETEEDKNND